jgi:hypothetical protein
LALREAYIDALDAYRRKDWEKALAGFEQIALITLGPRVCGLAAGGKQIRTAGPTYA